MPPSLLKIPILPSGPVRGLEEGHRSGVRTRMVEVSCWMDNIVQVRKHSITVVPVQSISGLPLKVINAPLRTIPAVAQVRLQSVPLHTRNFAEMEGHPPAHDQKPTLLREVVIEQRIVRIDHCQ